MHSQVQQMSAGSRDRSAEFSAVVKSIWSRQSSTAYTDKQRVTQKSNFMLIARKIAKDTANTWAKVEKLSLLARRKGGSRGVREVESLISLIKQDLTTFNAHIARLQQELKSDASHCGRHKLAHFNAIVGSLQIPDSRNERSKLVAISAEFKVLVEYYNSEMQQASSMPPQQTTTQQHAAGWENNSYSQEYSTNHKPVRPDSAGHMAARTGSSNNIAAMSGPTNSYPPPSNSANHYSDHSRQPSRPNQNTSEPYSNQSAFVVHIDEPYGVGKGAGGHLRQRQQQQQQQQQQYYQQQVLLEKPTVDDRVESMNAIQQTIVELGGIFTQMASMVKEQEEMVQRIDSYSEETFQNVDSAHGELTKYLRSVTANRRLVIKIFITLIVLFTLFILLIH